MTINNYNLMFGLLDIEKPKVNFILDIILLSVVILAHIKLQNKKYHSLHQIIRSKTNNFKELNG